MKKCGYNVEFKDGSGQIGIANLQHNLPFGKREMIKWLPDYLSIKYVKPVKSVKCFTIKGEKER